MKKIALLAMVVVLCSCAEAVDSDPNEVNLSEVPVAEFDPASKILPLPTILVFDLENNVNALPEGCNESETATLIRGSLLNALDGAAAGSPALTATFSSTVAASSLVDRIKIYDMNTGAELPVNVDTDVFLDTGERYVASSNCLKTESTNRMTIRPSTPFPENSFIAVVLKTGIQTTGNQDFQPSATWAMVRQSENPVTLEYDANDPTVVTKVVKNSTPYSPVTDLETLSGLDLLWKAHANMMQFVEAQGIARNEVLLGWTFKTQTISKPLDPNEPTSLAANLPNEVADTILIKEVVEGEDAVAAELMSFMSTYLPIWVADDADPTTWWDTGASTKTSYECATGAVVDQATDLAAHTKHLVPCKAVGKMVHGSFTSPQYLFKVDGINPSLWLNPLDPPKVGGNEEIDFVAMLPSTPPPVGGYPTVFYAHGIGISREQAFFIGAELNEQGIAVVSADMVKSGTRTIAISDNPGDGCAGMKDGDRRLRTLDGYDNTACLAEFFAPIPSELRDNGRQSVLDFTQFLRALKNSCSVSVGSCGPLVIDTDNMGFLALSLGGLVGNIFAALNVDSFKAMAFSATGLSWKEWLYNTDHKARLCTLIDGLIGAGVGSGELWDGRRDNTTAMCTSGEWKNDPSLVAFIDVYLWVLDSLQGVNYAHRLAEAKVPILIQSFASDASVPEEVQQHFADFLGSVTGYAVEKVTASSDASDAPTEQIATAEQGLMVSYVNSDTKIYHHESMIAYQPIGLCMTSQSTSTCTEQELAQCRASKLGTRQAKNDVVNYFSARLK